MGCCGQGRQTVNNRTTYRPQDRAWATPRPANVEPATQRPVNGAVPPAQAMPAGSAGGARLEYLHRSPVRVLGPVSGRQYDFSAAAPVVTVDARDVQGLVATGYFRLA